MRTGLAGIPASPGIVEGQVHLLRWEVPDVRHRIIPDEAIPGEVKRFHQALEKARERLRQVRARAEKHAGPEEAAIFDVQLSILEDGELLRQVEELIHQNLGAEKGFDLVLFEWRQQFASHARPMLRERVGDLIDVHIRVLSILLGLPDHDPVDLPKGSNKILVTHDLTPSLTVQLDREAIIGIATDAGTRTSHVAILARSLGLPAVVGLREATQRLDGSEYLILDGTSGVLVINPSPAQLATYRERRAGEAAEHTELQAMATADSVTLDGHWVTLRANVDLPEEAEFAAHSGAEGVGLMRTEFLVVGRATMPDEEEQYQAYRHVVEAFEGRPVVIRTFDVGGDKLPVGGYPTDPNPFLGWRAIRMCLDEPELFKTQLRALLRAAMHGDVRIMFPLIITLDEVKQAMRVVAEKMRVIVEGAGALPVAAALSGRVTEGPIVAVVSGGNIDLKKFAEIVLSS
jgi:phosphotransferase system enzyme I (PtsI)